MLAGEYLDRVGFEGEARADGATLSRLCRAHLETVPFENLDVQLGRPLTTDIEAAFDKIVRKRRGGWCYEMNGVFGWVLKEIGFDVTRIAGGVMREKAGDGQIGNHLCLLVKLDRPYLVDVGFGGSLLGPFPVAETDRNDAPYVVRLRDVGDGYWRFSEQAYGEPFSFDFQEHAADESLLARKCVQLQTDPASPFVENLVVQKRSRNAHLILRGRVLTTLSEMGANKRMIGSADEFLVTLRDIFGLCEPEAEKLWPAVLARHEAWEATGGQAR